MSGVEAQELIQAPLLEHRLELRLRAHGLSLEHPGIGEDVSDTPSDRSTSLLLIVIGLEI